MSALRDKHVGEVHADLTIICTSSKPANGYLHYYWTLCSCGNIKRYRYDQIRKNGNCGMCDDMNASAVIEALERFRRNGKEQ